MMNSERSIFHYRGKGGYGARPEIARPLQAALGTASGLLGHLPPGQHEKHCCMCVEKVENDTSPCSSRLMPTCRMFLHAFTSLSFLHLRRCSKHSVDLRLMLRWRFPHFSASFRQPAQSFVVLSSSVANTCTCRFAIFTASCTSSVGSLFPFGSMCAEPCTTTSTPLSRTDCQKLSSTFR